MFEQFPRRLASFGAEATGCAACATTLGVILDAHASTVALVLVLVLTRAFRNHEVTS